MESLSDEELVARSRLGGISAARQNQFLDALFSRYHKRVAVWCLRVTGDRNAAADLAQEVLLKAHRAISSWRADSKFSTWLYSIARNHCMNYLAARSARPEGTSDSLDFDLPDHADMRPDRLAEFASEIRQMKQLISSTLDETETRVMSLHYGDEVPIDAITRLLSLTNPSGAKAHIVSAKRKLKAAVARLRERKPAR